jgi:FkbM family methyltransferase
MSKSLSRGDLKGALAGLGKDSARRRKVIELLVSLEPSMREIGLNVREEITGPLVDAMHTEGELLLRALSSGVELRFPYRSVIARELVMAQPEKPDHAWEPQTTKLLLTLGRDGKTALIGGAYFGDHAVPLAREMEKNGGVCHCFEINHEEADMLRWNAVHNGLSNVVVNEVGLWDSTDARLVLVGDDSHAFAREASPADSAETFATITIDDYAKAKGIDHLDLIMLDIEGGELAALRGAKMMLSHAKAPAVVFEVHRSYVDWSDGMRSTEIIRLLEGHGYHTFAVRDYNGNVDMRGKALELVPSDRLVLDGPPHGFNMLALKDEGLISRRRRR